MAEVRLALAQRAGGFNKLLVLKLLRDELAADPEFLDMFLAEARVAALLNHPNIVQTNEVGTDHGRHFMAMEYLEGQPLSALIARVGRKNLPLEIQVFVLAQVLHGLHYAHELTDLNGAPLSLIHRDVSPQNVFLTYGGQVKLLDFGIAKVAGAAGMTKHGTLKGKIGYMAPEQARMSTKLDRRADIFAVGVMLWEALAQQRFVPKTETEVETLQRRISNEDAKLADVAPNADPVLAEICNKAVAFDADQRWSDAQSFAEALEDWLPRAKRVIEKELGALLVDTFNEERSKIRRVIEEESAKPVGDETSPDLRDILSTLDGTGALDSGVSAGIAAASRPTAPQPKPRTFKWVVAAVLVAGIGGAALFVVKGKHQAAANTASAQVEPQRKVPANVTLRIRAVPSTATVQIDDSAPRAVPYDGVFPRDEAQHPLRITAEGYEPDDRTISFANDVDLDVTLRKIATPAEPKPSAAATTQTVPAGRWQPAPRPKPQTTITPPDPAPTTTQKKPRHSIDETDPYSHQ
jgi:serine/threonine-protein kinase